MQLRKQADLRVSQNKIVECLMGNDEFMVTADMGVGKTGAGLTAMRRLLDCGRVAHFLVVAPLLVAEETWPDEIEIWAHTRSLDYEVLTGPADRREQRARRLPELSIVNRENIPWLIEFWAKNGGWPYDGVIIDEMSSFKNPTKRNKPTKKVVEERTAEIIRGLPRGLSDEEIEDKVTKELKKLKGQLTRFGALCTVRQHIDWIAGLTGTPSPNGMEDLYSVLAEGGPQAQALIQQVVLRVEVFHAVR